MRTFSLQISSAESKFPFQSSHIILFLFTRPSVQSPHFGPTKMKVCSLDNFYTFLLFYLTSVYSLFYISIFLPRRNRLVGNSWNYLNLRNVGVFTIDYEASIWFFLQLQILGKRSFILRFNNFNRLIQ